LGGEGGVPGKDASEGVEEDGGSHVLEVLVVGD
jgi:hypothetical protein